MRPSVAWSAAAGSAVGVLARNLPIKLAIGILAPAKTLSCDDDQAVSCAVTNLPLAVGQMVELGFIAVAVCAALAISGAVALGLGIYRLRRQGQPDPPVPGPASSNREGSDRLGLGLVAVAACLFVPGSWLLGSFVVFVAR